MSRSHQDTGKFRKHTEDKFYTKQEVAKICIETVLDQIQHAARDYDWIEPAAGAGAFFHSFPKEVSKMYAMDIEPDSPDVECRDFLQWVPPPLSQGRSYVVIGNPPFGRQSSMAKRFIQASCMFADVVAFILPRSFMKPSMNRVFPPLFHLVKQIELPEFSFLLNGEPYDVPCVFQLWQKKTTIRAKEVVEVPRGFSYVKPMEPHSMCVRRVGVYAGRCYKAGSKQCSPSSHYFIRFDAPTHLDDIIRELNRIQYAYNTVGPRSISKPEFNVVMNGVLRSLRLI